MEEEVEEVEEARQEGGDLLEPGKEGREGWSHRKVGLFKLSR